MIYLIYEKTKERIYRVIFWQVLETWVWASRDYWTTKWKDFIEAGQFVSVYLNIKKL